MPLHENWELEEGEVLKLSTLHWPVAGAGARGRLWISRVLVGTSLPPQECSQASHLSLGKPGEIPAPCHYTGPTHPHTMWQVAKENESQTSGPHSRQLPWTLSLHSCPCSSLPALFLCLPGSRLYWNCLLFVTLHLPFRFATLSFWHSQCSLRTALPSSPGSSCSLQFQVTNQANSSCPGTGPPDQ